MLLKFFRKKNWLAALVSTSIALSCMPTAPVNAAVTDGIVLSEATTLNSGRFFSSAYYEGYVYSISITDSKLYAFDVATGESVWSQEIVGFRQSNSLNRHVYVKDGYLYVLSRSEGVIRYSLANPQSPERVANYPGYDDRNWIEVEGDYIYLPDFSDLKSVKISNGEVKSFQQGVYTAIYTYNNYLYAMRNGQIDVFDIGTDPQEPDLISSKTTSFGAIQSMKAIGNTLFVAAQPSNGQNSYRIYWYDITNPAEISSSQERTWDAPGSQEYKRLSDIAFVNGMMMICSTDNKFYTLGISSGSDDGVVENLELIQKDLSISANPYKMTVSDTKVFFANTSLNSHEYEIEYLKLDDTNISVAPVKISGKAYGQDNVTVELAGLEKTVSVDEFGLFSAKFDDGVIPNGTYTVNAYVTDNDEITDTCEIDIEFNRLEVSADYVNNTVEVEVTNLSDTYNASLILVGYKNKAMADYDFVDDVELIKNSLVTKTLTINEDTYDAVKLIVARKTDDGYICTASKLLAGNDANDFIANIENDDFAVRCDMDYQNAVVGVNISAKKAVDNVLIMAKNPNGNYEYIDVVNADDVTGLEFALIEPYAENQPYMITVSSLASGKYLFETGTAVYIGETTINGILEDIDEAADEIEYFNIIRNNSAILNIDMSLTSNFEKLNPDHKTAVYDALHQNSYFELGAAKLKIDFDTAVQEELEKQAYEVAFVAVNSAATHNDFELAVSNNEILGIDLTKGYYSLLSPESKSEVFDDIKDIEYDNVDKLQTDLNMSSALWYINESSYSILDERLAEVSELLKVVLPSGYYELSNVQKDLFAREVANKDYQTVLALNQAISVAIENAAALSSNAQVTINAADATVSVNETTGSARYAFDTYNGYAYTLNGDSNIVIYDCTGDTINMIENDENNEYLNVGTYNNDRYNRYLYVEGGYLYVYNRLGNKIRQFSLVNSPENPQYVKDFSYSSGVASWMDVYDGYLYVSNGTAVTAINIESGESALTRAAASKFKCVDGYLFAVSAGKLQIYSIEQPTNPILVAEKPMTYTLNGTTGNRVANDIEYLNGFVFVPCLSGDGLSSDLWVLDVTDIENLENVDFVKLNGDDVYKRISRLVINNGLLFASCVDGLYYVFDISELPYVEQISKQSLAGTHYIANICDGYLYSFTGGDINRYPVTNKNLTVDNITVTKRPVQITGTSLGNAEVEITFANVAKKATVDKNGKFNVVFNDDFIPNGTYTAKARIYDGETVIAEKTGEIVIDLEPKLQVTETYMSGSASISVINNGEAFNGMFITCGYKNDELFGYKINEDPISTNYSETNVLNDWQQCTTVRSFLLKKTDNGYLVEWAGKEYGTPLNKNVSELTYSASQLGVETGIEHSAKKVEIDIYSKFATGEIMVAVLKPNQTTINSTSLEYFNSLRTENNQASVRFGLSSCIENSDYTVFASARGADEYLYETDTFKYYSPLILNPVFEQIAGSTANNVEQILKDNQDKLAIDLSTTSAYSLLEDKYKIAVLASVAGNNYQTLGSSQIKTDFNIAVDEQTACMKVNNASTVAELVEQLNENPILDINTQEDGYYCKLTDDSKQKLYKIFSSKEYSDIESIRTDYYNKTALEYVNQTSYDNLLPVLREVSNTLGLVFTSRYDLLAVNTVYLNYMLKEIAKIDYTTAADLNAAISDAAEYVYTTYANIQSGGQGSTGGGGGGFGASSIIPKQEIKQASVGFTDLDSVDWAKTAIISLAKDGVVAGRNKTTFAPLEDITREEFTKLVILAFDYPVTDKTSVVFKDVSKDRWSYDYINAAYNGGIINGISDTDFAPEAKITRQDMTVILYRVLKEKGVELTNSTVMFDDGSDVSSYAKEAVNALAELGIVNGVGENKFAPKQNSNRAMATQMIYNCLEYIR